MTTVITTKSNREIEHRIPTSLLQKKVWITVIGCGGTVPECGKEFAFDGSDTRVFELPLSLFERRHFCRSELRELISVPLQMLLRNKLLRGIKISKSICECPASNYIASLVVLVVS